MSKAKISTDKGDMIVELYDNETPITVNNFKKLASDGFYNGLNFHRVIPGFVAQGGCPNKLGNGGPGYTIPCEVDAPKQFHDKGVLSMAHAGRNTGGSQFFICHGDAKFLDKQYASFGMLTSGSDVLDAIAGAPTIQKAEKSAPVDPVKILSITITEA